MEDNAPRSTHSGDKPDHRFDEWQAAREIIANVDARLATLRQYGLSFVAGLLAAQGLIEYQQTSGSSFVPTWVKFSILLASYLVIVAIYDIDQRERAIQQGAVNRACSLEDQLDIHLTGDIQVGYSVSHEYTLTNALYLLFIGATTILGVAVLNPVTFAFNATTDAFLVAALITLIGFGYVLFHRNREGRANQTKLAELR